jgi:hypothetical protein
MLTRVNSESDGGGHIRPIGQLSERLGPDAWKSPGMGRSPLDRRCRRPGPLLPPYRACAPVHEAAVGELPERLIADRSQAASAGACDWSERQRRSRSVVALWTRTARYRVGRIRQRASRSSRSAVASRSSSSARSSARTALTSRSRKPRWRRPAKTLACASTIRGVTAWP